MRNLLFAVALVLAAVGPTIAFLVVLALAVGPGVPLFARGVLLAFGSLLAAVALVFWGLAFDEWSRSRP